MTIYRLLFGLLLFGGSLLAQTHTEVTREDNQTLSGNNTFTGSNTCSGACLNGGNGTFAVKNATGDAVRYVSMTGNDSNDGLSAGSAKATPGGALSSLPTCTPIVSTNGGSPTNPISGPCGVIYLLNNGSSPTSVYTISSSLTINSLLVRIIGIDKLSTQIKCTVSPCIEFYGGGLSGGGAPNPVLTVSGGLEKLTIQGNGSSNQICVYDLDAAGILHRDIRITGCNGTGAIGMEVANDANGESERRHLDDIAFDDNTTNLDFTASNSGGLSSIAHQFMTHVQFSLNNGQTAISLRNFATVACELCTGVINTNLPNTNTYTAFKIANSAVYKGHAGFIVDNGAAGTLTFCSGCTSSNFNVWGWNHTQTIYTPETQDLPVYLNFTAVNASNGLCLLSSGVQKTCAFLDGSNFFGFSNGASTEVFAVSSTANGGVWITTPSGALNLVGAGAGGTATFPANTGTVGELNLAQSWSATQRGTQWISDQGSACTNGELALSAGWQSTGSATVGAVVGTGQTCSWTITTGTTTAANPTITDTLTNALPSAATVCEMNIHGGTHTAAAGESFQQTTLSATAPVFTFNGTPTANGFTYFVTRRCGP